MYVQHNGLRYARDIINLSFFPFCSTIIGHAFPPDIGQGINSGLLDVIALDRALRGQDVDNGIELVNRPENLGSALENYQRNRGPEHRALIRLSLYSSSYQFNQPWRRHRIGKFFWSLKIRFRLWLHKISHGHIPASCRVLMKKRVDLTYRPVMRQVDRTTFGLNVIALLLLGAVAIIAILAN